MHLTAITLRRFRNIAALDWTPSSGLNLIWGDNGQGKTNLLEGMHLALTGRSFRTRRDDELIPWGMAATPAAASSAEPVLAQIQLRRTAGERQLRVTLSPAMKVATADGTPLRKLAGLLGMAAVTVFTPESAALLRGTPGERRRWLDWTLAQVSPAYLHALQRYTRALRQVNAILRSEPRQRDVREEAAAFFPTLAISGAEIIQLRSTQLAAALATMAARWSELGGAGALTMEYRPNTEPAALDEKLERSLDAMRRQGACHVGPHRDDFSLALDGHPLQTYGSQGQHRLAALALQLESAQWMADSLGERPILLLDDFGSELDPERRRRVLSELRQHGMQVFVTATDPAALGTAELFDARHQMQAGTLV